MLSISIVGPGRAGGALAIALDRAGIAVDTLIHHADPPDLPFLGVRHVSLSGDMDIASDVLIIATPDPAIRTTASVFARLQRIPQVALHLSGSLASDELEPLREKGVSVGSMHPLVSISDAISGAERFAGSYFCVEGDDEAVATAKVIVSALKGIEFSIETQFKPLYHAAAVMASGNVTGLFDIAIEMLSNCGLNANASRSILLPLLQSTVANLSDKSTSDALTGPFARGDVQTFTRHLNALDRLEPPEIRDIYLALAERSARLANGERSVEMLNSISIAKRRTGC